MPRPAKQEFEEAFFGYKMNADGTHTGRGLPKTNSDQLFDWIENWVETTYELRVTDSNDRLVMQIIKGQILFPARDDGAIPTWNKEKRDWVLEAPQMAPPLKDFIEAKRAVVAESQNADGRFLHCIQCKKPFTDENVKTPAGWRETQISGFCEICFDGLFDEDDDAP